jgi:Protein tyrosine and serine/threonine kinase
MSCVVSDIDKGQMNWKTFWNTRAISSIRHVGTNEQQNLSESELCPSPVKKLLVKNSMSNHDDLEEIDIEWSVPGTEEASSSSSRQQQQRSERVQRCIDLATACARDFDSSFTIHSPKLECAIPQFHPKEIILSITEDSGRRPHINGFFREYVLREVKDAENNNVDKSKNSKMKSRLILKMKNDCEYYSVKYLHDGILECDHGPNAATEMILEVKILMSLAQHPNITKLYGITSTGLGSLASSNHAGYFFITDRITDTLGERINRWRDQHDMVRSDNEVPPSITQRLEIALDIASALAFLHHRNLVFYIRPDKVGFDVRHGVVKLCNFGQARQNGMESHPRSVTQSDNIHVLAYTAPEIFCMAPAHTASDVYGFGVMLWEMMSLQRPFQGYDRAQHFEDIVRRNDRPLNINEDWDKSIAETLRRCWEPYKRPTMASVHIAIETRLLYQEPTNEIVDTASVIQRRYSEGVFERLLSQSNETFSREIVRRHSEGLVPTMKSTGGLESINVENVCETIGNDLEDSNSTAEQGAPDESDDKKNFNFEKQNSSVSSLLSGVSLDEMLQEVSNALSDSGEPHSNTAPSHKSRRNHSASTGSNVRRQSRKRTSRSTRRRSRSNATELTSSSNAKRDTPASLTTLGIRLGNIVSGSLADIDVASVDDEEDLIASIMSQSDVSRKKAGAIADVGHRKLQLDNERANAIFNVSKTEVRRSLSVEQRGKSPIRPRLRSKSRGREKKNRLALSTEDARSGVPLTPTSTPSRRNREKMTTTDVDPPNDTCMPRQESPSKNEVNCPHLKPKRFSFNSYGRSNSDSSLGIRRNRRASVAEVKQKFDFVPDTPKQRSTSDTLKVLQKSLEKASPIKAPSHQVTEKYPMSPTKLMAHAGKRILRGVFRIGSESDVVVDGEPDTPGPAPRPSVRRGSSSLVLDIVKQQSSARILDGRTSQTEKAMLNRGKKV